VAFGPDGELRLAGVRMGAQQFFWMPRGWDLPMRPRDPDISDELADLARRLAEATRRWSEAARVLLVAGASPAGPR